MQNHDAPQVLSQELMKKMDSTLKPQVIHWAAHYVRARVLAELCSGSTMPARHQANFPFRSICCQDYEHLQEDIALILVL